MKQFFIDIGINEKNQRVMTWILINFGLTALLVWGVFWDVEPAYNIAIFMAWVAAILGTLVLIIASINPKNENEDAIKLNESIDKLCMELSAKKSVKVSTDRAFDAAFLVLLAAIGHFFLAFFWILHRLGLDAAHKRGEEALTRIGEATIDEMIDEVLEEQGAQSEQGAQEETTEETTPQDVHHN